MQAVEKVLVVGAGVGGLATATAMAQRGAQVDIVEKKADDAVH